MAPSGLVFRDSVSHSAARVVAEELTGAIARATAADLPARDATLLELVLRAGAWECSLADAGVAGGAPITDAAARAYVSGNPGALADLAPRVRALATPERLRISRPEGFAYYALHPRDVAEAALAAAPPGAVTVVGVRTIGATLSAVVAALFAHHGRDVDRFTVRPTGHPYDRSTTLSESEEAQVRRRAGALFFVVDEGPGLSGSSFLSVAEALAAAGVPGDRIVLLGSRSVDPNTLVTRDAAARWGRFRSVAPTGGRWPPDAGEGISSGAWRARFLGPPERWPGSWTQLERAKFLSRDGRFFLKFEGLGPYGAACYERAAILGEEGLGPAPEGALEESGYIRYPLVPGRPLTRDDLDAEMIRAMGRYLGRRAARFAASPERDAGEKLVEMARANVALALGRELPEGWELPFERPALCDGKLAPQEWLRTRTGGLVKVDAVAHGDDHFFPGPTDLAWDLAGAAIEWALPPAGVDLLLESYRRESGDDARRRIAPFSVAYAAFRAAFCGMAAHGADPDEKARLTRDRAEYVAQLARALAA